MRLVFFFCFLTERAENGKENYVEKFVIIAKEKL